MQLIKQGTVALVFLALGLAIASDQLEVKAATLRELSNNILINNPLDRAEFKQGKTQGSISISSSVSGQVALEVTFDENDPTGFYDVQISDVFLHGTKNSTSNSASKSLRFSKALPSTTSDTEIFAVSASNLTDLFSTGPNVGDQSIFITSYGLSAMPTTFPNGATFGGSASVQDEIMFTVERVPEPLTILGSGLALGFGAYFKKEYSRKQKKTKAKA